MRRSVATTVLCIVPALVAGSALLLACEDGPNQTYSPASGTLFNNGFAADAGGVGQVDAALDAVYTGKTVLQICDAPTQRLRWASMLSDPMIPPNQFAGLDLSGGPEWPGLTVEQAEQAPHWNANNTELVGGNCQGVGAGSGTCGNDSIETCGNVTWGDSGEVNFSYNLQTHIIDQLDINTGYLGTMEAKSRDGKHDFHFQIGYPILDGTSQWEVPWTNTAADHGNLAPAGSPYANKPCGNYLSGKAPANVYCTLTDFYNAVMYSFAPGVGTPFGKDEGDCHANGTCLVITNDGAGNGYFGVRSMGTYILFHSTLPQPAASEPYFVYIDYVKFVPGSTIPMQLAINTTGPTTNWLIPTLDGGAGTTPCTQSLGQTFSQYIKGCVETTGDPGLDKINYNKVVGGLTHDHEEDYFNIVGINQDFILTPNSLKGTPVPGGTNLGVYQDVQDGQLPKDGDQTAEWYFDVRAYGTPDNEQTAGVLANPKWTDSQEQRGSALVMREYQRLVEEDLAQLVGMQPSQPGDCQWVPGAPAGYPYCTGDSASGNNWGAPGQPCPAGPTPPSANQVCTGMESLGIPGDTLFPTDDPNVGNYLQGTGWPSVIKPGDHYAIFLANPYYAGVGSGAAGGYDYGYYWDESLAWVTRVMGRGDVHNLPAQAQDRRYFFRWFGIAMIKYLRAYGDAVDAGLDPSDPNVLNPQVVATEPIDLETLFFDNSFGAQFDKFEYIDLSTIAGYAGNKYTPDPTKPYMVVPMDFEYGTDVKVANQRYCNWYKRMDREEFALYRALSPNKSDPDGAHANYGANLTNMFGSPVLLAAMPTYECAAVPFVNGAWQNTTQFPTAASDCSTALPNGPPGWLLDPMTGNSLMDKNGQQADIDPNFVDPNTRTKTPTHYSTWADKQQHTLLWQYPGVWGQTVFSVYHPDPTHPAGLFDGHSPIQVCEPGAKDCADPSHTTSATSAALEEAEVYIPNFLNPWKACASKVTDSTGTTVCDPTDSKELSDPIYDFIDWLPSQPGVGFPIPQPGYAGSQSDLWVQTEQVDFTGNLETYLIDNVPYRDPGQNNGNCQTDGVACKAGFTCGTDGACVASDHSIEIRAIEAHDFLGEIYVCQDPSTMDVLHVRMYTSTYDVLQWLANHPGDPANPIGGNGSAQAACNILIRYSPYDNYPDFITSLANGITLNTNEGQGFGRIVDATLFNPAYETITQ